MRFFAITFLSLLVACSQLMAEVRIVRDSANELTSVSYSDVERTPDACFSVTYLNNGLAAGGHRLAVSLGDVESELFGGQFATAGSQQEVCTRSNAAELNIRLQRFSTSDSQAAMSSINATDYDNALILAHGDTDKKGSSNGIENAATELGRFFVDSLHNDGCDDRLSCAWT
ncbi:MAG: hypothetical protein KDA87_11380 [Planctomycetales bacterium]|nr:hypothetical protein [Planctomycetales bacterium]